MSRERENISKQFTDYDINGNHVRAYYDDAHKLIFVLDETVTQYKPNVLLVIDSFDNRKWDDVLANDYGIDLETVRPKRDNKYQKLDIEYGGLDVYSELIDAYKSGKGLDSALTKLEEFRIMAGRRAAKERLAVAQDTISKSHETIERTTETISGLRTRVRELRAKHAEHKRSIGREPTKASAAKILKVEAQLDTVNEKLVRAKKRLDSAKRRLTAAEDDAEIARTILEHNVDVKTNKKDTQNRTSERRDVAVSLPVASVPDEQSDVVLDEEYQETEPYEPRTEEMADENNEEVKPLFDTDPNVLDDNIAFKPINFENTDLNETETNDVVPEPLSFTPPSGLGDTNDETDDNKQAPGTNMFAEQPVSEHLDFVEDVAPTASGGETIQKAETVETVGTVEPVEPKVVSETIEPIRVEPVVPVRPVSPISGRDAVNQNLSEVKKPTLIYYIMLVLLICLSIFTLWLYQKNNGSVVPDLAATKSSTQTDVEKIDTTPQSVKAELVVDTVKTVPTEIEPTVTVAESPAVEPVIPTLEPEPVVQFPEPVAVTVSEPEPVTQIEKTPVAVEIEPEPFVTESPFADLRTVANYEPEKQTIPTEEEILARKPGYNVSQQDKMFVASSNYDTGKVVSSDYSLDTDVQPAFVPEIATSEVSEVVTDTLDEPECTGGASADINGCCPGEEYTYTNDGYMCCADDDCFPPLQ